MTSSLLIVLSFVFIHFLSVYLRLPKVILRKFISFTAGVGISYVFVHLWPQVAHAQSAAEEAIFWLEGHFLHYAFYLMALFGLAVFYSMDRLIARAYEDKDKTDPNLVESKLFWSHMTLFALYNAMIGYLLSHREESGSTLVIFFIAFSLHFVTNDWGLRHHHEAVYDKYGRYILSLSIFAGFLLGVLSDFPEYAIGSVEALVTGAMTLNVIKHELPSEREGNLEGFLIGLASSGLLFIFL